MKMTTRKLVSLGVLAAISVVLVYFIHLPLIPAAPFLEYDPADIPILIATFVYGPVTGLVLTVVVSVIQGLTVSAQSGWIGILMHIFATGLFVLVAGLIYRGKKTKSRAVAALLVSVIAMTAAMVVWNIIFTPLFLGTPIDQVLPLLLPAIIPFNLIKGVINAALTFVLYKQVGRFLRGRAETEAPSSHGMGAPHGN